ncbi:MAG TPA: DUF4350 domain-containing protein [Steroidobacteraceae bacterium]|nr:DUF4350 domain-containing protein [Steroidobacteraceae bacterium]
MRERLVTLVAALGALALFAAVFLPSGAGTERGRDTPRPTTDEQRGDGYYAARRWLEAEGVRVVSLREHLGTLATRRDLPGGGNLLIVTLPGVTGFANAELERIDQWVRAGNTLLVVAALADAPSWSLARASVTPGDVSLLSGLSLVALGRYARPGRSRLIPNGDHAYFRDVREATALSDDRHRPWAVKVPYEGFALELAHERAGGAGVLWTRPLGAGRIIVSAFGSLFTNRAIGLEDNAQLLANLVAVNVAPKGAVVFDDRHQGLGAVYDPATFYRDPRLYETVGILLALWLAWVLGATRLRALGGRPPAPREADLLEATGGFLARVLRTDAAARSLFEHFLRAQLPGAARYQRSSRSAAAWRYLERHPRVGLADLERLEAWYADAQAGRRVPLRRVHDLIVRTEGRLRA